MAVKTIKIPDTTADMTMAHLPFFMALSEFADKNPQDLSTVEIADLLCLFFNTKSDAFDIYTAQSNSRLFLEICKSCAKHKSEPIPESYEVDGTTYVWVADYSKVNVAYHRELANCNFMDNPTDILSFCYIEKGKTFNQLNKSKEIINPRRERSNALKSVVSLSQFLDIQAFFLQSYPVLKMLSKRQL